MNWLFIRITDGTIIMEDRIIKFNPSTRLHLLWANVKHKNIAKTVDEVPSLKLLSSTESLLIL